MFSFQRKIRLIVRKFEVFPFPGIMANFTVFNPFSFELSVMNIIVTRLARNIPFPMKLFSAFCMDPAIVMTFRTGYRLVCTRQRKPGIDVINH